MIISNKFLSIGFITLFIISACSTTRIDQEVNAAYSIKEGESIVLLSDSYHTGNKTENDFMDCLNKSLLSCLLYTSPSPRDQRGSRMPSSA